MTRSDHNHIQAAADNSSASASGHQNKPKDCKILEVYSHDITREEIAGVAVPERFIKQTELCFEDYIEQREFLVDLHRGAEQCCANGGDVFEYYRAEFAALRLYTSDRIEARQKKETFEKKISRSRKLNTGLAVLSFILAVFSIALTVGWINFQIWL